MIAHLHGSVCLHTSAIKLNSIHSWKKAFQWVLSCNPNTVYRPVGKVPKKDCLFWFRASKNCVQQSLSNYSLLIFSSSWTRFILGVESCPKLAGRGHTFPPPGGVKLYQDWEWCIAGLDHHRERKPYKMEQSSKWDVGLRFWFGVRLDTVITLCWTHADCCNQMLSAV